MASAYDGERRTLLRALAEEASRQGLASSLIGGEEPLLHVWHPRTGRRTLVLALPAHRGWVFLWSPGGRAPADDLQRTARALREALRSA